MFWKNASTLNKETASFSETLVIFIILTWHYTQKTLQEIWSAKKM